MLSSVDIEARLLEMIATAEVVRCPYLPDGADPSACQDCDGSGHLLVGMDYLGECPHYAAAMVERKAQRYWDRLPASMRAQLRAMRDEYAWGQTANWQVDGYRRGLVMSGTVGTGKTLAMHRHIIGLIRRYRLPAFCLRAIDVQNDVMAMVEDADAADRLRVAQQRASDERWVYAIDDLGRERHTDAIADRLSAIIFALHYRSAPMVLTTNLTPGQLAQRYGEHISDRICDPQWTSVVVVKQSAGRAKIRPATAILA